MCLYCPCASFVSLCVFHCFFRPSDARRLIGRAVFDNSFSAAVTQCDLEILLAGMPQFSLCVSPRPCASLLLCVFSAAFSDLLMLAGSSVALCLTILNRCSRTIVTWRFCLWVCRNSAYVSLLSVCFICFSVRFPLLFQTF